jgi:hypothetical protein
VSVRSASKRSLEGGAVALLEQGALGQPAVEHLTARPGRPYVAVASRSVV